MVSEEEAMSLFSIFATAPERSSVLDAFEFFDCQEATRLLGRGKDESEEEEEQEVVWAASAEEKEGGKADAGPARVAQEKEGEQVCSDVGDTARVSEDVPVVADGSGDAGDEAPAVSE